LGIAIWSSSLEGAVAGGENLLIDGDFDADHSLTAVIRHRKTQETILEATCPITIVDIPTIDRGSVRQFNNLVAELLNQPIGDSPVPPHKSSPSATKRPSPAGNPSSTSSSSNRIWSDLTSVLLSLA